MTPLKLRLIGRIIGVNDTQGLTTSIVHLQKPTGLTLNLRIKCERGTHLPFILHDYAINVCAQNPTSVDTWHNLLPVPASAGFL